MAAADFWDNSENAQQVVGQLKSLKAIYDPWNDADAASEDLTVLIEMAEEDPDVEKEVADEVQRLETLVEALELKSLLDGPHDTAGAILTIQARDGGTDANDWAEMLLRMYSQWAQKNDFSIGLLDRNDNDEAGINSATVAIRGPMAYGYLKGETGIHRLVRISPFNSQGKRQTSFAAIDVSPEISDSIDIHIEEKDVREDTYRASGAGGQHVNKTDSAVRITHLPTGIVAQCQNERSQHKNKSHAMKILKARLYQVELEKEREKNKELEDQKMDIGWGSQIRSYVFHPYQLVKDHRTKEEIGNSQAVMDGGINPFIRAYLLSTIGSKKEKAVKE